MKVMLYVLMAATFFSLASCGDVVSDAQYIERAQDFLDKSEFRSASIELKNALQKSPGNAQARRLLGVVYLEMGDYAGAEKELTRARELGVAGESVLPLLARALLAQGKHKMVESLSVNNLSAGVGKAEVLAVKGLALLANSRRDEAEKLIASALTLAPKSSYVLTAQARLLAAIDENDKAFQLLDEVLKQDEGYAPAWSFLGYLRRSGDQLEDAEEAYNKAIESRDANTEDYLSRALVLIDLGKYEAARKDVGVLLKRMPKHPSVNYAQGLIYLHGNKLQEAKNAFELALKADRRQLLPKYYLALVNLRLGNIQQADDFGEQALAAAPASIGVRELLATIKLKQGKFAEAEELVRPIVGQVESDTRAIELLGFSLAGQGKIDDSIPQLEKAVALQPDSALSRMRLGAALLASDRAEEGVSYLESALQKDPGLHQARQSLVLYYLGQGQIDKATQVAEKYRDADPRNPFPWSLLGTLDLQRNDLKGAAKAFEQARKLDPGNLFANHSLAAMAIKEKQFDKARDYYMEVLTHHESDLSSLLKLALLDEMDKDEAEMVSRLQQAGTSHPKHPLPQVMLARYYLLKNQPGKVASLMVELDDRQKNAPAVLEVMAFSQLAQGQFQKAEFNLKALLKIRPDSAQIHYLLARAYDAQKDREAMKQALEKTVELAPKHLLARLSLARLFLLEKDSARAQAQIRELKKITPDSPDVLYLEAVLAHERGAMGQAVELLEQVFEKTPTTATMLAVAQQQWAAGNPELALSLQEKWVREHPEDIVAIHSLADAYMLKGEFDKGLAHYQRVAEKSENNAIALNNLAWHLRDSDPLVALDYAQRAAEIAPRSPQVLDTLAMVQLSNKQYEKAKRSNERALERAPENRSLLFHSAEIAYAAGDRFGASEILEDLLGRAADFPEKEQAEKLLQDILSNEDRP